MAKIIDMFTRKEQVPDHVTVEADVMEDFVEMAKNDPEALDPQEQEWFCSMFRDTYLSELLEAVRGIEEADQVSDLELFIHEAIKAIKAWPKVSRA